MALSSPSINIEAFGSFEVEVMTQIITPKLETTELIKDTHGTAGSLSELRF